MAQMTVRQIDDDRYEMLRERARLRGVSAESLARDAIHAASALSVDEKLGLVREMQDRFRASLTAGAEQTCGIDLIREDRNHGH